MSMHYFKMFAEFGTDPKVQSLSEIMQRRLTMLFCLRCSGPTEKMDECEIATHLRISEDDLAQTKAAFLRKGFIDEKWSIRNWGKRQAYDSKAAERMQKNRDKKRTDPATQPNETRTKPERTANGSPLELELELKKEEKKPPRPKYADEVEDEPKQHAAFNYEPSVANPVIPANRSGGDLADWNEAVSVADSHPNTKHFAAQMRSLANTPLVQPHEGWRFLCASRKASAWTVHRDWGYFMGAVRKCTWEEFNQDTKSLSSRRTEPTPGYHQRLLSPQERFGPSQANAGAMN